MKIKKILNFIFIFVLMFIITDNVFAVSFKCPALGEDTRIEYQIAKIVRYIMLILQIAVPILLVVLGSIDLVKGLTAQKEDEIKKGQQIFIKRLISGGLVFFVIAIVKLIISVASSGDPENIMTCVNCFIKADQTDTECGWE